MPETLTTAISPIPTSMVFINGSNYYDQSQTIVNEYAVMSVPAVWCGVTWKAGTLASLPKEVVIQDGKSFVPTTHPVTKLLTRKINRYTTPFTFWETFYHHLIIWGNAYALIRRNPGSMAASELLNLDPEKITPFRLLDGPANGQWYWVKDLNGPGVPGAVPAADMIHVSGLGFDGMKGYPLVTILSETFEWAKNIQRFSARYFRKGTQVQGSIEVPLGVTAEQIEMMKNAIRAKQSGMEADYGYMFLTGGAKLNNSTIPPEKSQLIQSSQASTIDIARILVIPPWYLFSLEEAKWANVEQMAIDAVKFSLRNPIEKTEEELCAKLLTDKEQDAGITIRFSVDDLERGDSTAITANTIAKVNAGIINVNEGRALFGMVADKDPEASKLRIPVKDPVEGTKTPVPALPAAAQTKHVEAPKGAIELSSIQPILDHAFSVIEKKTEKAFANKSGKSKEEVTIWSNVFATEQAAYVRDHLAPIASVIHFDVEAVAERYAQAIRKRAAGGEMKKLENIFDEVGRNNGGE